MLSTYLIHIIVKLRHDNYNIHDNYVLEIHDQST